MIYLFTFILLISTLHAQVSELEAIELTSSNSLLESEVLSPVPLLIIDEEKIKQRGAFRLCGVSKSPNVLNIVLFDNAYK